MLDIHAVTESLILVGLSQDKHASYSDIVPGSCEKPKSILLLYVAKLVHPLDVRPCPSLLRMLIATALRIKVAPALAQSFAAELRKASHGTLRLRSGSCVCGYYCSVGVH